MIVRDAAHEQIQDDYRADEKDSFFINHAIPRNKN
jgi:hypothetical protein